MVWICFMIQLKPAMGSFIGSMRMSSRRNIGGLPLRALQFEADIHEVVRRPWAGVEERELVLVLLGDVGDLIVERFRFLAIDQERGVEDHLVANRFVRTRGDGGVA